MLHLGLVEGVLHHFDGVFNGADIDLIVGEGFQGGVESGGFTRAGGAGHQHYAVGALHHLDPAGKVIAVKA